MGIDVNNKVVTFSTIHEDLVSTCPNSNPSQKMISGLKVQSVFRRKKSKDMTFDGNPLIYALKGKDGFSLSPEELVKFFPNFKLILAKAMADNRHVTIVAPMPSSHKIAELLARRATRLIGGSAQLMPNLLAKKTTDEVLEDLQGVTFPPNMKKDANKLLASLSRSPGRLFSMKDVKNARLRRFIKPLKLASAIPQSGVAVLLVDDLLSSGSTLLCAQELLRNSGAVTSTSGLCLLSPL